MALKIGVLGAGHLGKIHLNCISQLNDTYHLVGFYDPDLEKSQEVSQKFGYRAFPSLDELIDACDVIDIVTPTLSHYDCAAKALKKQKHLFIEKPVTHTVDEARELIKLCDEAGTKAQVGHVERFNPAFGAAEPYIKNPMFIESHRLSQFNPRGTDVSVVMDLMIHDIDLVLSMVNTGIKRISASGVSVVSSTPDIANARIEFNNGCVANLTASRISLKMMRKMRLFQRDAYITVDFLKKSSEVVRMDTLPKNHEEQDPYAMIMDLPDGTRKRVFFENPEVEERNAIRDELKSLADAIHENRLPPVTLEDGMRALEVASIVNKKVSAAAFSLK